MQDVQQASPHASSGTPFLARSPHTTLEGNSGRGETEVPGRQRTCLSTVPLLCSRGAAWDPTPTPSKAASRSTWLALQAPEGPTTHSLATEASPCLMDITLSRCAPRWLLGHLPWDGRQHSTPATPLCVPVLPSHLLPGQTMLRKMTLVQHGRGRAQGPGSTSWASSLGQPKLG